MPATLATSASYNDEDMGMEEDGTGYTTPPLPSHISLLPMLPTLLDLVDESQSDPMTQGIVASEPGENAESPTQTRSSVGPSLMPSSPTSSPRANMNKRRKSSEAKRDALADSYYRTTVEKYNYKLQLSQERTRREEMRLAVRREEKEREERLHREDKEREERLRKDEKDRVERLHKNAQDALLEVVRFVTSGSTSGGCLLLRSTVPNSETERPPSDVEPQSFSDSLP
ncbi:uncharacterized protein UTRI_10037 [Ustilago trichophora]|uniref:Uncharacterized protein n=1 Tax=Ustilago trichophora TaxID=86804 RepID=A0A5C3DQH0_9BASI|nr:uncharacterized protein UTRI_10037 [Ustilago trichophora]